MSEISYWDAITRSRTSRRNLLRAGAAVGIGAATLSLIGCGGSSSGKSSGGSSNLLAKPVDSDAKAVRGTTLPLQINNDFAAWNIEGNGDAATQADHVYSRIVKFKPQKYPEPRSAVTEGDAASAWEISPDGLQYTFKIRPNQKFDPRPPTSNRLVTAADLKFSWDRYASISPYGADLAAAADKTAPVLSVEAPDANTAVMKLAYPFAGLLPELSFSRHLVVLPAEADDKAGFNTKLDQRGSGMWRLKDYQRSASVSYVVNPDYYDAAKVLPGEIDYPILQEYTSRLAQFRAGRVATMVFQPEDILQTKKDLPQLLMMSDGVFSQGGQSVRFGFLPESPFRDTRLRQAISMLIDRDLFIETFRNTKEFENAGLDVPRRWHTSIPCGYDDFWLNPQDQKAFGENYKYYQFNQDEAKKLVRAVNPNGIETDFIWTNNQYGPAFANMAQVLQQMWQATGDFKLRTKNPDYQTDWRPNYDRNFGKYSGLSLGAAGSGTPDVNGQITARLHVGDNERTGHLDDNGKIDQRLEDLISAQRRELDVKKRASIIYEMQQYVAKQAYYMMDAGDAPGYTLAWPWVGNWGVYRTWTGGVDAVEVYSHLWIDEAMRKKG